MPNVYDYMLSDPTQERMATAANLLRKRRAKATLGVMTGDPVLSQLGGSQLENIESQAGGLAKSRAQFERPIPLGGGIMSHRGEIGPAPGYEDMQTRIAERSLEKTLAREERSNEEARARMDYQAGLVQERKLGTEQRGAAVIPEQTYRKVAGYTAQAKVGQGLQQEFDELTGAGEDISEPMEDIPAAMMRKYGLTGPATLAEKAVKPENVRVFRSRLQTFIDAYRHARFGSQLTGGEIQEFLKSNPLAYGLSDSEMRSRIGIIQDWYEGQANELAAGRLTPGSQFESEPSGPVDMVYNPETQQLEPAQ